MILNKNIKVISLFDGFSTAQQALKELNIPIEKYYASEIDEYAIATTQANHPHTIQVGDVSKLVGLENESIDLLVGGSPCQDLSIAKKGREGLKGSRSGLFYEYVRILREVQPKYFILENVASMPKEAKEAISQELDGIEPVMINASKLSAQNRKRYFWVGSLQNDGTYKQVNIPQPEDAGILLRDVLEENVDEKYFVKITEKYGLKGFCENDQKSKAMTATMHKGYGNDGVTTVRIGSLNSGGQGDRIYSEDGKSVALSANGGGRGAKTGLYAVGAASRTYPRTKTEGVERHKQIELRADEKSNCMTSVKEDSMVCIQNTGIYHVPHGYIKEKVTEEEKYPTLCSQDPRSKHLIYPQIRKLTPTEALRLQSMPDFYFDKATYKGKPISNTQRYKMAGNAFNCAVIKHIITNLK